VHGDASPATLLLVVGIVSPPAKFARRDMIRLTHMQDELHGRAILYRFLHGRAPNGSMIPAIAAEMERYGDGVLTPVRERGALYKQRDCGRKTHEFFLWALASYPRVPFFAKIEDDTFLMPARIVQELVALLPIKRLNWSWMMWASIGTFGGHFQSPREAPDGGYGAYREKLLRLRHGRRWNASATAREPDWDAIASMDMTPFATGMIDLRSNALARDLLTCEFTRARGEALFEVQPLKGTSCDHSQGVIVRFCAPEPWVILDAHKVGARNLVGRYRVTSRDLNAVRRSAVVHPVKDESRGGLLWHTFWNASKQGTPFSVARSRHGIAVARSHHGVAVTARTDRSTGELHIRELRLDQLLERPPPPEARQVPLASVTRAELLEAVTNALRPSPGSAS
jgi:hypothetical protein